MNEHDIDKPTDMDFVIKLRAVDSDTQDVPPIVRLRRLLKACLRGYGFRAVHVEDSSEGTSDHVGG